MSLTEYCEMSNLAARLTIGTLTSFLLDGELLLYNY
jgi:hypothetical protein